MDQQIRADLSAPADAQHGATTGHANLAPFVGAWRLEGRQLETDVGPAAEIHGVERFEWLSGGFFLIHNFHAHVGDGKAACLEIIAYDAKDDIYPIRSYYDDGQVNEWTMRDGSGIWIMNGDWDIGGEVRRVRCAIVFVAPQVRTCLWEYAVDGAWRTFWEVRAVTLG
jgi:hypothetical protein